MYVFKHCVILSKFIDLMQVCKKIALAECITYLSFLRNEMVESSRAMSNTNTVFSCEFYEFSVSLRMT